MLRRRHKTCPFRCFRERAIIHILGHNCEAGKFSWKTHIKLSKHFEKSWHEVHVSLSEQMYKTGIQRRQYQILLAPYNSEVANVHVLITFFTYNRSWQGLSHKSESGSRAICLFRTAIHFPWTEKKRHPFLIFTMPPTKIPSKFLRAK